MRELLHLQGRIVYKTTIFGSSCFLCIILISAQQKMEKMKTLFVLFTAATLSLAACAGSKGFNINGTYSTDFGDLELKENQKKVTGSYTYPGEGGKEAKGTLSGELKDKTLSFNWEQIQGDQKAGGTGSFMFSNDGKSFTGTWSDTKGGTGQWNGTKK